MPKHEAFSFKPGEFKGSRFRCLLATHQPRDQVAAFLTAITGGAATITLKDRWAPCGFLHPDEAKLDEANGFLNDADRETVATWWLARRGRANTPNWDVVSTADVGGARGLVLVEAKAHAREFADDRCGATHRDNFNSIRNALDTATSAWNRIVPGFSLSAEHHYQLSNRFAFAWKLASLRIPTVLVYLGFLNATEMVGRELLRNHSDWHKCVTSRAHEHVPAAAWNRRFEVGERRTPVHILISSADVSTDLRSVTEGGSA